MKTIFGCCILFATISQLQAQVSHTITFAADDPNTTIDSVVVKNITQDTQITVKNGAPVTLVQTITSVESNINESNLVRIYPNPIMHTATLEIMNPTNGNVTIQLIDYVGKLFYRDIKTLQEGRHLFQLDGIEQGIYILSITTAGKTINKKIISLTKPGSVFKIQYNGMAETTVESKLKSTSESGYMPYLTGDYMLYQGHSSSGEYWTTDSTGHSATVIFYFKPCTDIDNNKYPVVRIGRQFWMARNLRTTHYANGQPIKKASSTIDWAALKETGKGYCWYNNDSISFAKLYGALYTWPAATNGSLNGNNLNPSGIKGACPDGWHLPSDAEWVELITYLGGQSFAGTRLKEAGTKHWFAPNMQANNKTGFTALPGGVRSYKGPFSQMGTYGVWWTASKYWWEAMNYYYGGVDRDNNDFSLGTGFSVRCVKD